MSNLFSSCTGSSYDWYSASAGAPLSDWGDSELPHSTACSGFGSYYWSMDTLTAHLRSEFSFKAYFRNQVLPNSNS